MERLQEIVRFNWQGRRFETWIFQRDKGGYTAKTKLGHNDWIATDGDVEHNMLRDHWRLLSVALLSRGALELQAVEKEETHDG